MFSKSKTFYFTNLKKKSYRKKGRSTKRSREVEKKTRGREETLSSSLLLQWPQQHN